MRRRYSCVCSWNGSMLLQCSGFRGRGSRTGITRALYRNQTGDVTLTAFGAATIAEVGRRRY